VYKSSQKEKKVAICLEMGIFVLFCGIICCSEFFIWSIIWPHINKKLVRFILEKWA